MGGIFAYLYIFKNIVCILTLDFIFFLFCFVLFFCVRFQGATKQAFVVNAIRLALEYCQLFTPHHATKVVEVVTKYRTNMGITFSSSSLEE
jgi:hypothetical protein